MKNIFLRVIIAILIIVILFFIGNYLIGSNETSCALSYVGAIVGGGSFWIGSRP